ncbi:hypothetical protein JW879_06940 [candidate division WOR-3 bacterium]|nr:hypothetical protein [candidate division WOR-3 bacterium]
MKSFLSGFLFILTAILLIDGCAGKSANYKYFRKVDIDGRYSIIGKYPLSPEMGNKGEAYRFLYNKKGELIRVDYLMGGKLRDGSFFGNNVAQVLIEHFETYEKRAYFDVNGLSVRDRYGVYSIRLELNDNNLPTSKLNCGVFGEFTEDIYGVVQYLWTLDGEGRIKKAIFYDFLGKRLTIEEGGFETAFKYDEDGNMIERSYFDSKGNLKENKDGVAVLRQKFDDKGNIIEIRQFDAANKLIELGNGVAVTNQKFDEDGNIVETRYLGKDEKLKENNMGVAIMRCRFDAYGNIVEQKYYDMSDKLTEGKFYGFATRQWEYDEDGKLLETRFLDVNGNLKNTINEEAAILRMKYDKDGNLEQILHLDKEGNPVEDSLLSVPLKTTTK